MERREAIRCAGGLALAAWSGTGRAQAWPARPITMVVASSAGSGPDLLARELAGRLSTALKQPVVVDNKPGASGIIATQAVTRAAPDGHTVLYSNATNMVMAPSLLKSMPYDVRKDLVPVAQTAVGGVLLLVGNAFPARTLPELIAAVRAKPNTFSYGTWAVGSSGHLAMEWLKRQTGMSLNHVPYKQSQSLLTDLAAGTLDIGWSDPAAPLPFVEQGKLRPIAVIGNARPPKLTQVPTFGEQGYPFDAVGWFGVFLPAEAPKEVVVRLNDEINRINALPEMVARSATLNIDPPPRRTPEEFRAIMLRDLETWKKIVVDAGITLDG